MTLLYTLESFEHFNYNLIINDHHHQGKAAFYYLLSSKTLINNDSIRDILQLHSCSRFGECYALIMKNINASSKAFYSKLSSYLLSLEELSIKATVNSLTNDYLTSVKSRIDFTNATHRIVLYDYFNIKKDNSSNANLTEEMLFTNIVNLLEYYAVIEERKETLSMVFNEFFCSVGNHLGTSFEDKNKRCFINNFKAFLNENQLSFKMQLGKNSNKQTTQYQKSYMIENKYIMPVEENKAFDDKLNYIYESLKDITFDSGNASFQLSNNAPASLLKSNSHMTKEESNYQFIPIDDTELDSNYIFLKKLKIFSILKKKAQKRKLNKKYYAKKAKMKSMAMFFYWNLLKSRTFFGFAKLMKQKVYFNITKNNYIDHRIGELSHRLIHILSSSFNRSKLASCAEQRHFKVLKKKVISYLKEKAHYKLSFNQYLISQIFNNQYAIRFMVDICSNAKNFMRYKPKFKALYNKMQKTNMLNENRRLFHFAISALDNNRTFYEKLYMRFKEIQLVIDFNCLISKIKQRIVIKKLKRHFMQKLFIMRYYVRYYQHLHDKQVVSDKKKQVMMIIFKHDYFRLKQRIMIKASHKAKMSQIIKTASSNQSQERKQKSNSSIRNKNEIIYQPDHISKNKSSTKQSDSNLLYCLKLKQSLWRILTSNHMLRKQIDRFKEINTKRALGPFFKLIKIKVIRDLINQGIIEKIKQYQSVLFLQVLFSSYFARLKYTRGKAIQNKFLMKTALVLLSKNVNHNYKMIQLKMQYIIRLFSKKVLLIILNKAKQKQSGLTLTKLMHQKTFISIIKYRIERVKERKELISRLLTSKRIKSIKLFLLCKRKMSSVINDKGLKNRKVYSKVVLNAIKKAIDIKAKNTKLKAYLKKCALTAFNKYIQCNIVKKTLDSIGDKYIKQNYFLQFIKGVRSKRNASHCKYQLNSIVQKFYGEFVINLFLLSSRLKSISGSVYQIYLNKIKEKIFHTYKQRYINNIKASMLELRYREFLVINAINIFNQKIQNAIH